MLESSLSQALDFDKRTLCRWMLGQQWSVNGGVSTRWCPSSLAKLVNITPITMVFVGDISIVFMGFINQLITVGHNIVCESSQSWAPGVSFSFVCVCLIIVFPLWQFNIAIEHGLRNSEFSY